jgi:hypothetical protein
MTDEKPQPDRPLSPEEEVLVTRLTDADLREIDDGLLAQAALHWRKVARVVSFAMSHERTRVRAIPESFYAQRVRKLVADGLLESQGNLAYMRFSEVRLRRASGRE